MEHLKEILGGIATALALISYVPYLKDVLSGKTKPHAFTWLIWGTLTLVAFLGQISGNAGPGAWPSGVSVVLCFSIFILSLRSGTREFAKLDFVMLAGAALALFFWFFIKQPLFSLILVVLTDILGFVPTIRKSWSRPHEETASAYLLNAVKHYISLYALRQYSPLTMLYPAYLLVANTLFVSLLWSRRTSLRESAAG